MNRIVAGLGSSTFCLPLRLRSFPRRTPLFHQPLLSLAIVLAYLRLEITTYVFPPLHPVPLALLTSSAMELSQIENMMPTSAHMPIVAGHIANQLLTPDILFVQEVQDNSGATNDGVVNSNVTLTAISNSIFNASGSTVKYDFVAIDPVNNKDGGQPGGNIRQAYLCVI